MRAVTSHQQQVTTTEGQQHKPHPGPQIQYRVQQGNTLEQRCKRNQQELRTPANRAQSSERNQRQQREKSVQDGCSGGERRLCALLMRVRSQSAKNRGSNHKS